MTDERLDLDSIEARWEKATPGPWAHMDVGEKGHGGQFIGVYFGPGDDNCEHPLSGELEETRDDGHLDYFCEPLVAICDYDMNCDNPHANANAIAAAPDDIRDLLARCRELEEENRRLLENNEGSLRAAEYWKNYYDGALAEGDKARDELAE